MIERALDQGYPPVAAELKSLARQAKGMDGRGMCRRFLEHLTRAGWGLVPPVAAERKEKWSAVEQYGGSVPPGVDE